MAEISHTGHAPPRTGEPPGPARQVDDLSTVQLVERLTDQVTALVRTEIRHGAAEMKGKGARIGAGVGVSGAGVLLLLYGLGSLVAAAVLGLAVALEPWVAALIVAAVLIVVGGTLTALGGRKTKDVLPFIPDDTTHSVQEDVETVKEHWR
ncbi:phage holin family protein [Rhodococcus sp. NPDC003318]|uniref:phage holin family protein n=1 Tax=Rhodococcus sp. NPDC003318 TaxID=3364503 RepID=UPI0036866D3F